MSAGSEDEPGAAYRLRLFVAGSTARSRQAIENLRRLLADQALEAIDLEVIDIYQQPDLAGRHQIIAAPTLLKLSPPPVRRIVGDLSDVDRLLRGLDLPVRPPEERRDGEMRGG